MSQSLTQAQKAKIEQKEATLADSLKRDVSIDYKAGWFFVTLNTRGEAPILSSCKGSPNIPDGQPGAPHCEYTKLGEGVKAVWQSIPKFHKGVTIDAFEAMPEHVHGLLYLKPGNEEHLGKIIGGFMSGCTHAYWDFLGIDWRKGHPTQGRSAAAQVSTAPDRDRDHTCSYRGPALFVRGYNDMEPITEQEVQIKRDYIRDQARKRLIKGGNYECFHIHRDQHSRNWTTEVAMNAISADRFFANNPDKCHIAQQGIAKRLPSVLSLVGRAGAFAEAQNAAATLSYLGNRNIMAAKKKLPLICHRADAWCFDKQKEAVLTAARNGAVIVSAFISPKEREIKEQLMQEFLPLIEIMDNGFAERYKPIGHAFYAVAEMRMVQITPWTYLYQKDTQVSREMCLVMNELTRIITGEKDDWWKS